MRRDISLLKKNSFIVSVFDEIQHVKNRATLGYDAAAELQAEIKLGLTGTPVENSLGDLKALFDLVLPGYLGSDQDFSDYYEKNILEDPGGEIQQHFSRIIHPFIMRRLKQTLLKDLPEKIEDVRTCRLSREQVRLYRDAIASRGHGLIQELRTRNQPVPYIHIFALLNLLKQICNHPAILNGGPAAVNQYEAGKWELFKELLSESLDSGQKVVIYSQFVKMIDIIEAYLKEIRVGYTVLTGKSKNRGRLISRFNTDPECRVFVGSLKAGGTGIDLVSGSVVIHYDRWWNAAREDQATDRVHRIGQKRGVHVFKLVTEGTLEKKISAIIQKKRHLMDRVIQEDDPGLLKTFSKEELLEMLSGPI